MGRKIRQDDGDPPSSELIYENGYPQDYALVPKPYLFPIWSLYSMQVLQDLSCGLGSWVVWI